MTPDELQARLEIYARDVVLFAAPLFDRKLTENAADQLSRSASAASANYRSCCRARSHREFTARVSVALEEVDESVGWLEHLRACRFVDIASTEPLIREGQELTRILGRSYSTARRRDEADAHSRRANHGRLGRPRD